MVEKTGPTRLGKLVVFLVLILACLQAAAGYFFKDLLAPRDRQPSGRRRPRRVPQPGGAVRGARHRGGSRRSTSTPTCRPRGYPEVQGVSAYKWDENEKIVEFPINVWIGWLPIVAANHGFAPNEESIFFRDHGFKVNLKLIDDPVVARDAFAAGESHVLWGTLDMMVLMAPELMRDSRTAPRIFQQIDWSNGGDGIVVRGEYPLGEGSQRQDGRLRPEQPFAVLPQQPAPQRGHPARRGRPQVHSLRLRGRRGVRLGPELHRRLRLLGTRHLQHSRSRRRHSDPDHHGRSQQADRRRLGRARRFRQGPPGDHRRARQWHLQGDGSAQARGHLQGAGLPVDGRRLRLCRRRGPGDGGRRPQHQLRGEQVLLPEQERARPTSSAPGRTSPSSTASSACSVRRCATTR